MRELKFHAWDKKKKKWIWPYPDPFSIIGEVTVFDMLKQYKIEDFNDIEIVQYTGFKHKIEIYENHLLKVLGHYEPGSFVKEYIGKVIMIDGEWRVENKKAYGVSLWDYCHNYAGGVVGNINEHPELIEEQK